MSAAAHRSERHGSINWGRKRRGGDVTSHRLRGRLSNWNWPKENELNDPSLLKTLCKSTHLLHKVNEEISDIFCVG